VVTGYRRLDGLLFDCSTGHQWRNCYQQKRKRKHYDDDDGDDDVHAKVMLMMQEI